MKDIRGLWAVYNVFIDDHLLARKGQLPLYDGDERIADPDVYKLPAVHHGELRLDGHPVLVKNPQDYDVELVRRLRASHCYTEVSTEGGHAGLPVRLKPFEKLPPECDQQLNAHEKPNH
jgi:hypothetical protein